ncbi:MAG TPA: hydrogenase maturation protease [Symbiobacteriaceae bacterium]|nr:hydrogenase maturation protease [Symbiobacteriaceae bacterium]
MTLLAVGIGNPDRSDDRAGLVLARLLRLRRTCEVMVAGTAPEAITMRIKSRRPDVILLIDAVQLDEAPGAVALLTSDDLEERPAWHGHRPPLALLMRYLAAETGARVLLLGIQPGDTGWGRNLTPAVRGGIRRVAAMAAEIGLA